jgi:hypothetical protein
MSDPCNSDPIRSQTDATQEEADFVAAIMAADRKYGRIAVLLLPSALFQMVAEVQLALRHPHHPPAAAKAVEAIARDWQAALARHVPEVAAILEAGWDLSRDVRMTKDGRPSAPGPRGSDRADGGMVAETVADALYLDQWEQAEGLSHVGSPQCPHCGYDLIRPDMDMTGTGDCPSCEGSFRWRAGPSPVGFAWTTWAVDTPEEERGPRYDA